MPLNLIVVVFDTLRYDAVFGDLARTPNLDRFASQSVVFTNAWGEGLPTIPFRRALYTGRRSYPWDQHEGDRGSFPNIAGWHRIPESQTTLSEYLYARGYATQLISDVWHQFKATQNFVRGFVSWEYLRGQEGDTFELGAASLRNAARIDPLRVGPASYLYQQRNRQRDEDYFVAKVLDRAGQFVGANRETGPYCLWVESFSPHEFWDPPLRYADAYDPAPDRKNYIVPQLLNRLPAGPESAALARQRQAWPGADGLRPGEEPDPRDIARTRALYQGYVTFCDERFGHFLDTLEQAGALEDSIVVVMSDHGTELWDKGQFGKAGSRLYPYNTQINLMIRHPDLAGARRCNAFVQNQDLVPTLLPLLGIPCPRLDGDNIWPQAIDGARSARDHVVIGWERWASIRDADWNLILDTSSPETDPRLFNLAADPTESENVAAANPEVVTRQIRRLETTIGQPLPAIFQHRPLRGVSATPGGLREARTERAQPGERWSGSNQV